MLSKCCTFCIVALLCTVWLGGWVNWGNSRNKNLHCSITHISQLHESKMSRKGNLSMMYYQTYADADVIELILQYSPPTSCCSAWSSKNLAEIWKLLKIFFWKVGLLCQVMCGEFKSKFLQHQENRTTSQLSFFFFFLSVYEPSEEEHLHTDRECSHWCENEAPK